jgi:hypothetical protein
MTTERNPKISEFGVLGLILHGKADTYWHIVESLKGYPGQDTVREWLEEIGFDQIGLREQLGGQILKRPPETPCFT